MLVSIVEDTADDSEHDDLPMTRLERVYCNDHRYETIFISFRKSHLCSEINLYFIITINFLILIMNKKIRDFRSNEQL